MASINIVAAIVFALALLHTFSTKLFERLAQRSEKHAGLFHLLGEVEIVFGLWAFVLMALMAAMEGRARAIDYAESRQYTEPLFVFVIMVVAASRPVLEAIRALVTAIAARAPAQTAVAHVWVCLALVPLIGSLITEPAAMTLAALLLAPRVFRPGMPEWLKYGALGALFVNVSIGGTLTSFAAPPVLMVAGTWDWNSAFMAKTFGWRAAIAVLVNATAITLLLRRHLSEPEFDAMGEASSGVPPVVSTIHLAFLAAVVAFAHHPVIFGHLDAPYPPGATAHIPDLFRGKTDDLALSGPHKNGLLLLG